MTVRQVYDTFIPNQSLDSLRVMAGAAVLALALDAVLRWSRAALHGWQGASDAHRAGCRTMQTLLAGGVEPGRASIGGKLALLSLVRGMHGAGAGQGAMTLAELTILPLVLVLIALIAGRLVLVTLGLIALFGLFTLVAGSRLHRAREERQLSDTARMDFMVETLGAGQTVKALSAERILSGRHAERKFESTVAQYQVSSRQTLIADLTQSFGTVMIFAVILYGALLALQGRISVGAMVASIILSGRATPPLQKALAVLHRQQALRIERAEVGRLLDAAPPPEPLAAADCPANTGQLALESVVIVEQGARDPRHATLLERTSLVFPERDISLIDGATHGEFAQFFATLCALSPPEEGQVMLNGADIARLPPDRRAAQIGYLRPETVLYRGTIMDNLSRFGQVPVSDLMFVAHQLRLDEDLRALPQGFDTTLRGDGGDPVPPGLRQRIALARALASRPRVILFNHADTGLDRRSYTALYDLFARLRGQATVLIASDDPTIRALAHHRFVLQGRQLTKDAAVARRGPGVMPYREFRL
ncbi:ABC transporter ATP-binding protein [Frigidibacter sp. MR17.24]|uniref:ABC transporter ATP-binding protein n=1 Tax=Frigidibacter sp. MR17.24 TaxID=3127345 RepID=UPI0030130DD1